MHQKASSLAAALTKADNEVPKLDVGFDDESTRPVPLSLIRMFAEEGDMTLSLKIAVPENGADPEIQINTGDQGNKKTS